MQNTKIAVSFDDILLRAQEGIELSREEGLRLVNCNTNELPLLLEAADKLRKKIVGDNVTFVVNRNINFTNVCYVGCRFCAFSRSPKEGDAYFLSMDEIKEKTQQAKKEGATEVCVQGGLPLGMDGFHYVKVLRAIKDAVPEMHVHGFSPMEIQYGIELTGMSVRDYLKMLKDEGLGSLPGTAAEILDDNVREIISVNKLKTAQWVNIIKTAHSLGIPSTSTLMYGHIETVEHWLAHLILLRDIQKETGGFTEFVPLGFVHTNTDLYKHGAHNAVVRPGPTEDEHLKIHALARIMLSGWINNIQVSWVKLGEEMSRRCLQSGANDYGGTLMEENISRLAGAIGGDKLEISDMLKRIRAAGRIPAQRDTKYDILKIYDAQNEAHHSLYPNPYSLTPVSSSL